MRSNRDLMGEVSKMTRIGASDRLGQLEDFMKKFGQPSNNVIKQYLSDWKIQVDYKPIEVKGKQISPREILFANGPLRNERGNSSPLHFF